MSLSWMPFYIGDYLKNTRHLSAAEHGAYLLLIFSYWEEGALPSDETRVMRLSGMTEKEWKNSRNTIAAFFEDGWKHPRIEAEMIEAIGKYEKRASAGSKGGHKSAETRKIRKKMRSEAASSAGSNASSKIGSNASTFATSNASKKGDFFQAKLNQPQPHSLRESYPGSEDTSEQDRVALGGEPDRHGGETPHHAANPALPIAAMGRNRA